MNKPFEDALILYKQNDADFGEILKWHFAYGVVVSLPDCFLLGFFCDKQQPLVPKELAEADCVFVSICVGDMHQAGVQIVELVPYIAYQREFKNDKRIRIKNFRKFYQKLKWAV